MHFIIVPQFIVLRKISGSEQDIQNAKFIVLVVSICENLNLRSPETAGKCGGNEYFGSFYGRDSSCNSKNMAVRLNWLYLSLRLTIRREEKKYESKRSFLFFCFSVYCSGAGFYIMRMGVSD